MKILSQNNNISFGSNYKFNIANDNSKNAESAANILSQLELKNPEILFFSDFMPFNEISKTGIFEKIHISAPDTFDEYIESVLNQRGVKFEKHTKEEDLDPKNIYKRIVLPKKRPNQRLVSLDVKKVDDLFKENDLYIFEEKNQSKDKSFQNVRNYLATGRDIDATEIVLSEKNDKLFLSILDGRHRFCVMRDLGMDKIKFALSEDSCELAYKYGLIADEESI